MKLQKDLQVVQEIKSLERLRYYLIVFMKENICFLLIEMLFILFQMWIVQL